VNRKPTINARHRGTVMLLVVVCLGLMAVLGAVYLVVARTDRMNVRAINSTMDMDLAQQGVLSFVAQQVHEATLDSRGVLMGDDFSGPSGKRARKIDIPETGATFGTGGGDASTPDQPWLTLVTDTAGARFTRFHSYSGGYANNRFNPSTGAYDLAVPGSPEVAVMDPTGSSDSVWYMLPSTSGQAIRYRFAVRIVDTSGLLNLNTGSVDNALADPHGTYLSSLALYGWTADTPATLHSNANFPKGRGGGSFAATYNFLLEDWHHLLLHVEFPQSPDAARVRSVRQVELFDYTDELELRALDPRRIPYASRPETLWPATLGDAAAARRLYTAYSFDRNLRPPMRFVTAYTANTHYVAGDLIALSSFLPGTAIPASTNVYECTVPHIAPNSVSTPPASQWRGPFAISTLLGTGVSPGYLITATRTRRPVVPLHPRRINVNATLPPAPTWTGDRTYLAGDVATGPDGNTYLCTMSHYGYANAISHDIYAGAAPAINSGYAPTAPGRDAAASAYWDYLHPFVAGVSWMPGQRALADNGNVYICRYPIPATSGGRSPRDDQPYRVKLSADPGNSQDYGGYYWRLITTPPRMLTARSEVVAQTAASLAAIMRSELCPLVVRTPNNYTEDEALAFAATYTTARYGSARGDRNADGTNRGTYLHYLPAGPSFIDDQGVCIRGGRWNTGSDTPANAFVADVRDFGGSGSPAAEFKSSTANRVHYAYAAQPFVNEVASFVDPARTTPDDTVDIAIELFNPYAVALDLTGWRLSLRNDNGDLVTWTDKNGANTTIDVDLGALFPNGIGAYTVSGNDHYVVITRSDGGLNGRIAANTRTPDNNVAAIKTETDKFTVRYGVTGTWVLTRPVLQRGGAVGAAVVDRFSITGTVPATAPTATDPAYVTANQRSNANRWTCAWDLYTGVLTGLSATAGPDTLGAPTTAALAQQASLPSPLPLLPLHDRWAESQPLTPDANFNFRNLADFNRIMRVGHTNDKRSAELYKPSSAQPNNTLLGERLSAILLNAVTSSFAQSEYPYEAQIRFDFRATSGLYANPTANTNVGDPRAVTLLDYIALVDRAQDLIDVGNGVNDINKVRLPGRINVNTASAEALKAISPVNMLDQHVANIVTYRTREFTPVNYNSVPGFGFSSLAPNYLGYGIRSTGELYYVLRPQRYYAWTVQNITGTVVPRQTASWGSGSATIDSVDTNTVRLVAITGTAPTVGTVVNTTDGTNSGAFTYLEDASALVERDTPAAKVLNLCTVRSDAFVVYATLEAIRINPRAGSATDPIDGHNNGADWYGAVTDDPDNSSAPNQLVARRRFMAIVDRSWANAPRGSTEFTLPRIAGTRDLPP